VSDLLDVKPALEHSIKLAKTYGARIVLMYLTGRRLIPREYVEYAKAERIQDYNSAYFASLGDGTISDLKRRIEEEGVECASYSYIGNLGDAIKACRQNTRVLMLILTLPRKSHRGAFRTGSFKPKMVSDLNVPVLLVPT